MHKIQKSILNLELNYEHMEHALKMAKHITHMPYIDYIKADIYVSIALDHFTECKKELQYLWEGRARPETLASITKEQLNTIITNKLYTCYDFYNYVENSQYHKVQAYRERVLKFV